MKRTKGMKRALAAALAAACLFAGCASRRLPVEEPAATPAPEQEVSSLSGSLAAWEEGSLTVATEEGRYTFAVAAGQLEADEPLRRGSPVEVRFCGEAESGTAEVVSVEFGELSALGSAEQAHLLRLAMTDEEKVGQLFLVRWPGDEEATELAQRLHLGGYVLFADFFAEKTPDQVRKMLSECQAAQEIPMLLAVDEEGGTVNRISCYPQFRAEPFASPQRLYAAGGLERVAADTAEKCALLANLGLNLNLAPVCDVSQDAEDFIYYRTLGRSAEETADYVRCVVEAMAGSGVGSCLKHFPGYGSNADTHTGMAMDEREYEQFAQSDFLPFSAGIEAGAGAVMVCHNIVTCMDSERPASLSAEVHRVLRQQLGFEGVIITDDLSMEGIRQFCGEEEAAVAAVQAGNDLLCCTDVESQYAAVLAALQSGKLEPELVDAAVERVIRWKGELGLFEAPAMK